jgi:hypothetical protein
VSRRPADAISCPPQTGQVRPNKGVIPAIEKNRNFELNLAGSSS